MRRLTFTGYLESYVQYLADRHTRALAQLAVRTQSEPRLAEPLLLFAATTGQADRLARLLQGRNDLERELATLSSLAQQDHLEAALAANDSHLREEYKKVWRSYVARRDSLARDAELKLEARRRALELAAAKGVSQYRMAKDLGLNGGNLNAFLKHGNSGKLSLDRAFGLLEYLEAA